MSTHCSIGDRYIVECRGKVLIAWPAATAAGLAHHWHREKSSPLCTRLAQSEVSLSLALTLLVHIGTLLSPCTKAASCLPASTRLHKLPCPAVLLYPPSASESVFLLSLSAPGGADRALSLYCFLWLQSHPHSPAPCLGQRLPRKAADAPSREVIKARLEDGALI